MLGPFDDVLCPGVDAGFLKGGRSNLALHAKRRGGQGSSFGPSVKKPTSWVQGGGPDPPPLPDRHLLSPCLPFSSLADECMSNFHAVHTLSVVVLHIEVIKVDHDDFLRRSLHRQINHGIEVIQSSTCYCMLAWVHQDSQA